MQLLKQSILFVFHSVSLFFGWVIYVLVGLNTTRSQNALVFFFCKTGGRFQDTISSLISAIAPPPIQFDKSKILGALTTNDFNNSLRSLNKKGFAVLPILLPEKICDDLVKFSLKTPALVRAMDDENKPRNSKIASFQKDSLVGIRYDYPMHDLLANSDIQNLISDPALLTLAQMYLKARPKIDVLGMWWHTNFGSAPDSEAAQLFHFDLDRLKWVKVFIYLTDVEIGNGPHTFIEGSHIQKGIPEKFLRYGYSRLTDADVHSHYGKDKQIIFTAPRGTIIFEDTRGLHKGAQVFGDPRLILQLQFSNSLFGGKYPKFKLPGKRTEQLDKMISLSKDVFKAYL